MKKLFLRNVFWIYMTPLLISCGQLPGFAVNQKSDNFKQSVSVNTKIDLLFIVDNSGSMAAKQTALATSFATFMNEFITRNLDFHIAVISTDMNSNSDYWANTGVWAGTSPYKNFVNSGPGSFLSYRDPVTHIVNDRVLSSSSSDVVQQFKQNVQLGRFGSGAEMGLLSATTALQPAPLATGAWNANFLRDEALLSIIEITDEDESETNATYVKDHSPDDVTRLANFKSTLLSLKPGHPELVRFDVVTSPYDGSPIRAAAPPDSTWSFDQFFYYGEPCSTAFASGSSVGYTVGQAAEQNNGTVISVCSDFGSTIASLGGSLLTALTKFHLVQPPVGNDIQVTVNGVVIPQDATNGWTYDSTAQEVSFHGTAIPPAGADINVSYVPSKPIG